MELARNPSLTGTHAPGMGEPASLPPPCPGPCPCNSTPAPQLPAARPLPGPRLPQGCGPQGRATSRPQPASVLPAGPARGTCPRVLPEGPRTARPDSSQHSGVPTSAPAVWPRQGTPVLLCGGPRPDLPITRVGAPRPLPGLAPAPCPSQRSDPPMGCQPHPATPTASDTAAWPVGTLLFLPSRLDTCSPSHTATLSPVSTSTCLQNTQMTRRTLHPPATTLRPTATQEHRLELGNPPHLLRGCHQALSPTSCVCLRLCPAPATALRPAGGRSARLPILQGPPAAAGASAPLSMGAQVPPGLRPHLPHAQPSWGSPQLLHASQPPHTPTATPRRECRPRGPRTRGQLDPQVPSRLRSLCPCVGSFIHSLVEPAPGMAVAGPATLPWQTDEPGALAAGPRGVGSPPRGVAGAVESQGGTQQDCTWGPGVGQHGGFAQAVGPQSPEPVLAPGKGSGCRGSE